MELGKSIENHNDVVVRLTKHVIATVANGSNLVFSPISINVLLSLIAAGSCSVTKEQILSFLMLPSTDHLNLVLAQIIDGGTEKSDLRLSIANGVWIDKFFSLKLSFKDLLENSYKATCSQVDFASKPSEVIDEVNTWAEVHTNGLIKQILSRDSIDTIRSSTLVLANAVYFKGAWSSKFDANMTKKNDFHLLDGTSVKVPFMTNYEDQYLRSYDGFKVLRLPYIEDQRQFSMYIYLPNDKEGLAPLLEKIGSEPSFFDNHIPLHCISVGAFRIPKFKFSFEFNASEVLKDMGLTSPFNNGGGLTEMVDSPSNGDDLYVSSILHKACIEVDEEGTEAAAVSVGVVSCTSFRRNPDFVADRPFLFTVREDKSGVILFMGQVLDPSKH
ncbi:Serine protease inhibitor (SERPIN) family protein [Arabidopsis thaliana]|jgi:serpin B|uniref:Serpin-Z10 n=1 Tax=Arabidopsis thaliana TaxID=3702 RepID=SPZ10_ARATH|nr:Serine protease inhibitor (SERPIN) family protein [Arabidopsis thaliana]Q9SIR9.1 RecName: Full=Serpin-Z10; AltName: Full=ArathZ10 [Arabidopsis thaliana]AAD23667.1 putative serpin [Arabidopsis thaliana]AEC07675.1 Serine protease inhibitor (SERPIN) family protein [Arabidopsis thaliana]|eukprot:NP_180096.3 Serine protease inhibitor (SERPIN) family protein [Arabidopsis thaliana]